MKSLNRSILYIALYWYNIRKHKLINYYIIIIYINLSQKIILQNSENNTQSILKVPSYYNNYFIIYIGYTLPNKVSIIIYNSFRDSLLSASSVNYENLNFKSNI